MLTGKTRHRVSLLGKHVLQVEYITGNYTGISLFDFRKTKTWRDATTMDLLKIERGEISPNPYLWVPKTTGDEKPRMKDRGDPSESILSPTMDYFPEPDVCLEHPLEQLDWEDVRGLPISQEDLSNAIAVRLMNFEEFQLIRKSDLEVIAKGNIQDFEILFKDVSSNQ